MDRWQERVALVTGASSGIGFAIAKELTIQGMTVVGVARNIQTIQALSKQLEGDSNGGRLVAMKCDLTKDREIYDVFKSIEETLGGVDVCINNAGLSYAPSLLDGSPDEWRSMMDVNVISVCLCTKLTVASMRKRGVDDGHIINISSTAGHQVQTPECVHFYSGTKFAIKSITEGLRQELRAAKSHIRATTISPGLVETEFVARMYNSEDIAKRWFSNFNALSPQDISASVLHVLSAPPHVEINDILMRPTEQDA